MSENLPTQIKFSLEVKDNAVHYSYSIGRSFHACETPFSAEWLFSIMQVLELASQAWKHTEETNKKELSVRSPKGK